MKHYHKIQTIFKREIKNQGKIIEGEYSLPELEYLKNNIWIFTEKVNGTNIRILWNGKRINFGGKTDNAQLPVKLLYKLQEIFDEKTEQFKNIFEEDEVCLYGEGYGAGTAKGSGNYSKDPNFVLFDVKIGEWWLERKNIEDIASKLNLTVVPIIGLGTLSDMIEITRKGFNSQWGNFIAEGIVARPQVELKCRNGDRLITKIKYCDFN